MEIEKEQNIVVKYIPQYIVIETRYKSLPSKDEQQQVSKTTSNTKYERLELDNSHQETNFHQYDAIDYAERHNDNEFAELKQIANSEGKTVDSADYKLSTQKRKNNSKASKLLNDWFLDHLHNPYPTEEEKDVSLLLLVGNPNAWRLGRIDELDHETAV